MTSTQFVFSVDMNWHSIVSFFRGKHQSTTASASPWLLTINGLFLSTITLASYGLCRVLGIICFGYNCNSDRVETKRLAVAYSVTMLLIAGTYTPIALQILYADMVFLRQNDLLTYVGYIRYGVMLTCALATLLMQVIYRHAIVASVNQMLHLWSFLLDKPNIVNGYVTWKVVSKCSTALLQVLWIVFLIEKDNAMSNPWYLATLFFVHYCLLVLQMTLNMLYFGVLLITLQIQQLNAKLIGLLLQLRSLPHHRGGLGSRFRSHLLHRVGQLMHTHFTLVKLSISYVRLYGLQLLGFLMSVLMECITQIFIMYFVPIEMWRQERKGKQVGARQRPLPINPYAVLYVLGLLWDMFLVVVMLDNMRLQFLHTRHLYTSSIWLKALTSSANLRLEGCVS
ncbi:putative gustatory receptor 77a [Musca vetustissima]|uniref:putative gustatory receptor 77a n=1 Tax=Musca vetustissima TaxID=27455 RepID=UPI002AB6ADD7|nr:putative gustatory receptor 77a [Musca vetustissima]